jgi:hypothetical protein
MISKLLPKVLIYLFVAIGFQVNAKESITPNTAYAALVGQCYASVDDYFEKTYGPDFRLDENLKIHEVATPKTTLANKVKYTWALDTTPSVNITRVLFKVEPSAKACSILYAPTSSSLIFTLTPAGDLPTNVISKDSPSPGLAAIHVSYHLNTNTGIYEPSKCVRVTKKIYKKNISCDLVFR